MALETAVVNLPQRLWLIVGICLAAVSAALVSQYVYDMQPCPWCVLQRALFIAIALACGIGLAWRGAVGIWVASAAGLLLALSGMAAALWQHFVAAASTSCNLTLADRILGGLKLDSLWPAVFNPTASCADAAVNLLGVPYEFWSLALFVVVAALVVSAIMKQRPREGHQRE
jgi:disulfide bond formation protein DsbB